MPSSYFRDSGSATGRGQYFRGSESCAVMLEAVALGGYIELQDTVSCCALHTGVRDSTLSECVLSPYACFHLCVLSPPSFS
jgi:hypothetical protein